MNNSNEKIRVFNKLSKVILTLVFTIWALGEIAYYIGRYVNCS
jgi:hypothetical protein